MDVCRHTFGLSKNPFGADLPRKDILVTPVITATKERIDYAVHMGGVALITGDIGSGKSTILRYLIGGLHPAEYQVIAVTACSGSILELYRQILAALGITKAGASRAMMAYRIKQQILDLVTGKKMKTLLVIDEASLLRLDVFAELHTLTQFEQDSKPYLPVILAGQANLVDNLSYRASKPLASRVVTRCHLGKGLYKQSYFSDWLVEDLPTLSTITATTAATGRTFGAGFGLVDANRATF